jgi:quercetin dioxygenase-like cupin family protein
MRRRWAVIWLLAAMVGVAGYAVGRAQEGTPVPDSASPITTELLGVGVPSASPENALQLIRYTLAADGRTEPHIRPGIRLTHVESGTYGVTVVSGRVVVWRAGDDPAPEATQPLAPGVEHVLQPGDALFIDEGAVISSHAVGDEPLVLVQAAYSPADDLTTTSIPVGTPTPNS